MEAYFLEILLQAHFIAQKHLLKYIMASKTFTRAKKRFSVKQSKA